jgi:hypothetical protein
MIIDSGRARQVTPDKGEAISTQAEISSAVLNVSSLQASIREPDILRVCARNICAHMCIIGVCAKSSTSSTRLRAAAGRIDVEGAHTGVCAHRERPHRSVRTPHVRYLRAGTDLCTPRRKRMCARLGKAGRRSRPTFGSGEPSRPLPYKPIRPAPAHFSLPWSVEPRRSVGPGQLDQGTRTLLYVSLIDQ